MSLFLGLCAFFLYAPTFNHDYAFDDSIVITNNPYTQKGIGGLVQIWTNPVYITEREIYRPVTQTTFAIEKSLFGSNPGISHIVNTLLYAACCLLFFWFLRSLFPKVPELILFLAALLFAVHPIHTEVVANIKSRDEILAFLFGFAGLISFLKLVESKRILFLAGLILCFSLACLSKINAITLIGVLPFIFLLKKPEIRQLYQEELKIGTAFSVIIILIITSVWFKSKILVFIAIVPLAVLFTYLMKRDKKMALIFSGILLGVVNYFFPAPYVLFFGIFILTFFASKNRDDNYFLALLPVIPVVVSFLWTTSELVGSSTIILAILVTGFLVSRQLYLYAGGVSLLFATMIIFYLGDINFYAVLFLSSAAIIFLMKRKKELPFHYGALLICLISIPIFLFDPFEGTLEAEGSVEIEKPLIQPTVDTILQLSLINNTLGFAPGPEQRWATTVFLPLKYIGKLLFPHPLVHNYGINSIPYKKWMDWAVWFSIFFHLMLLVYALSMIWRGDPVAFGILFYFITFSIYSQIYRLGPDTMAERFLFMPSAGFCIALAAGLAKLLKTEFDQKLTTPRNLAFICIIGVLFIACIYKTLDRNRDWKDDRTLILNTAPKAPNNAFLQFSVADYWYHAFENNPNSTESPVIQKRVIEGYNRALEIHPKYYNAAISLGQAYLSFGQTEKAISQYEKARSITPENPKAEAMLGLIYYSIENWQQGINAYENAIKKIEANEQVNYISAEDAQQAYMFLARCYFKNSQLEKAEEILLQAEKIYPGLPMFSELLKNMKRQVE